MQTALEPGALAHIIGNMREWDRREIFATRTDDCEVRLLEDVMNTGAVSWLAWSDVEPVAAYGCAPLWSGVWSMWLFATDKFHNIGIGVTRHIIRDIVPAMWRGGAHRLECLSMEGHVEAQRWLETIGASREFDQPLRGKGRGGENFYSYIWERG